MTLPSTHYIINIACILHQTNAAASEKLSTTQKSNATACVSECFYMVLLLFALISNALISFQVPDKSSVQSSKTKTTPKVRNH